jgi:hypothetical protein
MRAVFLMSMLALVESRSNGSVMSPVEHTHVVFCVTKIILENIPLDRSIFVSNNRADNDLAHTLLKAIHGSWTVASPGIKAKYCQW